MADFRRQTPAGELQISVAEITEAADPLGPRLKTPLVFSIARFPFAKRKSSFPIGEPEVRIHLPPARSLMRTCTPTRAGDERRWLTVPTMAEVHALRRGCQRIPQGAALASTG